MNVDLEKGSTSVVCVCGLWRERERKKELQKLFEYLNLDRVVVLVHVIQQNGRHSFSKLALSFASLSRN